MSDYRALDGTQRLGCFEFYCHLQVQAKESPGDRATAAAETTLKVPTGGPSDQGSFTIDEDQSCRMYVRWNSQKIGKLRGVEKAASVLEGKNDAGDDDDSSTSPALCMAWRVTYAFLANSRPTLLWDTLGLSVMEWLLEGFGALVLGMGPSSADERGPNASFRRLYGDSGGKSDLSGGQGLFPRLLNTLLLRPRTKLALSAWLLPEGGGVPQDLIAGHPEAPQELGVCWGTRSNPPEWPGEPFAPGWTVPVRTADEAHALMWELLESKSSSGSLVLRLALAHFEGDEFDSGTIDTERRAATSLSMLYMVWLRPEDVEECLRSLPSVAGLSEEGSLSRCATSTIDPASVLSQSPFTRALPPTCAITQPLKTEAAKRRTFLVRTFDISVRTQ